MRCWLVGYYPPIPNDSKILDSIFFCMINSRLLERQANLGKEAHANVNE